MTVQANMHEAKSTLSQLADRAVAGETVIIAKAGKPYVQLVPLQKLERKPDRHKDKIHMDEGFYEAAAIIEKMFYGEEE